MMTAKIFENGRSQAVRIPKEYRFDESEVSVNKVGEILILMPCSDKWNGFRRSLDLFTEDFMADGRTESVEQEREAL